MLEQPDLFSHAAHLDRVSSRIGAAIVDYCGSHPVFHMDDLRRHIVATVGAVAPGSPDRTLRALRAEGKIAYRVVNRRKSLYEVTA